MKTMKVINLLKLVAILTALITSGPALTQGVEWNEALSDGEDTVGGNIAVGCTCSGAAPIDFGYMDDDGDGVNTNGNQSDDQSVVTCNTNDDDPTYSVSATDLTHIKFNEDAGANGSGTADAPLAITKIADTGANCYQGDNAENCPDGISESSRSNDDDGTYTEDLTIALSVLTAEGQLAGAYQGSYTLTCSPSQLSD